MSERAQFKFVQTDEERSELEEKEELLGLRVERAAMRKEFVRLTEQRNRLLDTETDLRAEVDRLQSMADDYEVRLRPVVEAARAHREYCGGAHCKVCSAVAALDRQEKEGDGG